VSGRNAPCPPMRHAAWLAALALAACAPKPSDNSTLILNDPYWERVNVELVITKRADCDSREEGYITTKQLAMRKNTTESIDVPNGATVCWRHDRNPNEPVAGAWSGWTKASIPPGKTTETSL
jgi:hypothetical protein